MKNRILSAIVGGIILTVAPILIANFIYIITVFEFEVLWVGDWHILGRFIYACYLLMIIVASITFIIEE